MKKEYKDTASETEKTLEKLFIKSLKGVNVILSDNLVTIKKMDLNFKKSKIRKFKNHEDALKFYDKYIYKLIKRGYVETSFEKNPEDVGITSDDVLNLIDRLDLPDIVRKIFLNDNVPKIVDKLCSFCSPYPFFDLTKTEQLPYGNGLIYPIFSGPDFYRITAYDIKKKKYLVFDIEDSVNRNAATYYNWSQMLVMEFADIIENEFNDAGSTEINELSEFFDFEYGKKMFEDFESKKLTDFDEILKWKSGLVKRFSDKNKK